VTPWSATNAQYRANVLLYLRTLASRGARPALLVSSRPYTAGAAGDWWRQVAEVSDLVQEVYFPAPSIYAQGPVLGSRTLRNAFRRAILNFTQLGIPISKLGIMLGFQTGAGTGGREGLKPATAWFETVKWQALAAKQVGSEWPLATIWSWGWGNWGQRGYDPDKPAAACVWLWTRDRSLCDGPAAAGAGFDTSLTEGQIRLPRGVRCVVDRRQITNAALGRLQSFAGDRQLAYTTLFARAVENARARVTNERILVAERAVIALRFHGSAAAYRAAVAAAGATVAIARGVIGDELRRAEIEGALPAREPSGLEISSFYFSYPSLLARAVVAKPAPWWLGGRTSGVAISSLAPAALFRAPAGRTTTVRTMDGLYVVRPSGLAMPLGALPPDRARPAIVTALKAFARGAAFDRWTVAQQTQALKRTTCLRDDLPTAGAVDLTTLLPFLSLTG
jgi:hypothetical protein